MQFLGKQWKTSGKELMFDLCVIKQYFSKLTAKNNFQHATIFDENLVAVHMRKTKLFFNKPVFVGMSILDIAKILMFDFHFNYAKKKRGEKCQLCFTDTDSLLYEIKTDDFFENIKADVDAKFDTSDFPPDHPSGIAGKNKKFLGMMKDEALEESSTNLRV